MTATERVDPGAALQGLRFRFADHGTWIGPAGHLAAEHERLSSLEWDNFESTLHSPTLGAELSGIDITGPLADDAVAELRQALLEFKVLFFRDQPFSGGGHVAFAKRFGELETHPFIPSNTDHDHLTRFEKGATVGGYENTWHHDVTWQERPSMAAVLHAVHVPEVGGDTLFADMGAAYDGLEDDLKERLEGLNAVHDWLLAFGHVVPEGQLEELRAKHPPVRHPVVRTHPETGRRSLFVNRLFVTHIDDVDPGESTELLVQLCREAEHPEYQVRFRWQRDSVAFWDNRAVQHYAASDYWPRPRTMHRASICGDRPA